MYWSSCIREAKRRTKMKIKGVDLSYCQEGISFPALKQAGVRFAIIRAGFSTKKDVTMDKFVADCKKYGIDYGFYWYSYAMSVEQALTEAEKCIEVIKTLSPTYPVFFDMEEKKQISGLNTDTRTKMAIAFCEKIRQAGFKPGVYVNPSFMENYYDKSRIVGKYDIWLAHWTNSPDCPSKNNYGQTMWQWGLDRISGYDVDGDICFTDYGKKNPVKKTIDQLADEVLEGKDNAVTAQSQEAYLKKYESLTKRYETAAAELARLQNLRTLRSQKDKAVALYIRTLKKQPTVLSEWNDTLWTVMVEKAIVHRNSEITFVFYNGTKVKVRQ